MLIDEEVKGNASVWFDIDLINMHRGIDHDRVKPKTIQLVVVAAPLSTQHQGERSKTGWLEIGIIQLSVLV